MDDSTKSGGDSDQFLYKMMQKISADRVRAHNWNTWSLVLLCVALVAVILLDLKNVNVGITSAVVIFSVLSVIIFNRIHRNQLEKQLEEGNIDRYQRFLFRGKQGGEDGAAAIETTLSQRELQILQLIAEGNINKQIARELGLSPATVRNHVSRLMQKLDVNDRTAAAVMALSNGWIKIERQPKRNEINKTFVPSKP